MGTAQWFFGLGSLDPAVAVLLPCVKVSDTMLRLDHARTRVLQAVLDVTEWEAAPVQWRSPLHQAVRVELAKLPVGGKKIEVSVKARSLFLCVFDLSVCFRGLSLP